jgi:hypothetical protein
VKAEAGEPKQYVVAHLREAIAQHPHLNELNVDVSVAGGRIFLRGVVATDERRQELTRVVRELAPDYEVCNETELARFPRAEGAEELP